MTQTQYKIIREIYKAVETLGADMPLLAAVGSWGDTLEDGDVLDLLTEWNETHQTISKFGDN